jgi:TonB-dependent starch-binding outer membrane protein SusC
VSGRNLLTSTKYTGYDPEVSNFSNQNVGRFQDVTPYPSSRSFFFSLSANF